MNNQGESLLNHDWRLVLVSSAIVGVLLVGLVTLLTGNEKVDLANPFWFVGLLVVFGASLTLIAVVFRWLGMTNREEAFALPSGSIRTLMAIGIMVLFAMFGLNFFATVNKEAAVARPAAKAVEEVEAPAEPKALADEVDRYAKDGFAVVVSSRGKIGENAVPAKLKLYRVEVSRPADQVDMQKQMLTAMATLLTTVIGFYFGTRSAEGARDKGDSGDSVDGSQRAMEAELKTLEEQLAQATQRYEHLKTGVPPTEGQAAFDSALSLLPVALDKLKSDRGTLISALSEARGRPDAQSRVRTALSAFRDGLAALKTQLDTTERLAAHG